MASYQKRGKTWQYTVSRTVNGKSSPIRKGGFKTKKEAQVAAAEVESQLNKGLSPISMKKVIFAEYFETWLNLFKPKIGKNTRARYLVTLETIKQEFLGVYIQDVTKRSYQEFLNKYGKTHGLATSKKINSHIRACVREAVDEGIIRVDFTRGAQLTGSNPKKPEEKHLNYFEFKRLQKYLLKSLDHSNIMNYAMLLALTSGMRFGELAGLTRSDFNFKTNKIHINKTWGYTNKMPTGFGPTKNEQSVRLIKMDKKTMKAFKELFDKTPKNPNDLVFYSTQSKYQVISNNGMNKALKALLTELNMEEITVHGLRHTHISVLLYKKVSLPYVSERAGHKDTNTTNAIYRHVLKELRDEDEESTTEILEDAV
ncbi:tyrosine-type recombinase/integrase [Pullulanibacillus sp. KACC 23026]|uniref:site-specific integrase n=1 Tax=Pullulanibacillus sp. KACC 23026 TaxID=3028315 RepID=UPI0023AEAFC7|nr:tyrosine-type recombinase/integrase [Pullulanibacillus sp. KACC 23026]WEG13959.1 tyrosine-type recombinase/integrase [Pullulanibacillus sp. KACC 23026]